MNERRKKGKKEKKEKGQVVVSLLRMVLLLNCCRGGTSESEEDCNRTLHNQNQTSRRLKLKKEPKKSFFKRALGLFGKSGAGKNGLNEKGKDITGLNDDTGVKTLVTGPSSSPHSHTSTNSQMRAPMSSVKHKTETCMKVTFTADLHPIPGPSHDNTLHEWASLLESFTSLMENRTQRDPRDLHARTIMLLNKIEASGSKKLTKKREDNTHVQEKSSTPQDTSAGSSKTTNHLPTPPNGHLLFFNLFL
ncbi:hypothetical protein MHYP_G00267360 [Metynnis hypsauchen]